MRFCLYSREEVSHGHGGSDTIPPPGFSCLAEANKHARICSRLICVVVVDQESLFEPAVFVVVALRKQNRFVHLEHKRLICSMIYKWHVLNRKLVHMV